jgi:hypothetical protein
MTTTKGTDMEATNEQKKEALHAAAKYLDSVRDCNFDSEISMGGARAIYEFTLAGLVKEAK